MELSERESLRKEFEDTGYTSWINSDLYPDGRIYTQEYTEWLEKKVSLLSKEQKNGGIILGYLKDDFENQVETFIPSSKEPTPEVSAADHFKQWGNITRIFQKSEALGITYSQVIDLMESFTSQSTATLRERIAKLESLLGNAECPNECVDGKFKSYNPPLGTEEVTCPWCADRETLLNSKQ